MSSLKERSVTNTDNSISAGEKQIYPSQNDEEAEEEEEDEI